MRGRSAVYLAGRMNHEKNRGHEWREKITPFLNGLGFEVLNPYEFETKQLNGLRPGNLPKGIKHWVELRHSNDPNHVARFVRYMRRIIRYDLNLIKNNTDYIIVLWDEGCKTGAGTHSELTFALELGIPVYCVERAALPYWARACCEAVFPSFNELKLFLEEEFGPSEKEGDPCDKEFQKIPIKRGTQTNS